MRTPVKSMFLFFMILSQFSLSRAQITIEPDIQTDSVDLFSREEDSGKSRTLATMLTVLLPGAGHQYIGKNKKALLYFTSEALIFFGAIFSEQYSRRMFSSSRAYAVKYADIPHGDADIDDAFWGTVGNYMDIDEYNLVMELNRTPEEKYTSTGLSWRWPSEEYLERYNSIREDATKFHVVSNFFMLGFIVDRIVAFLDIRYETRQKSVVRNLKIDTETSLSLNDGLTSGIHFRIKF